MRTEEGGFMKQHLIWVLVAMLGAFSLGTVALSRGRASMLYGSSSRQSASI